MVLDERGIESTVVMFGGARIPSPEKKEAAKTPALAELSHFLYRGGAALPAR